jgi:predicted CXXCH cytochrome family protein
MTDDADDDETPEPVVECLQCHTKVPERQLVRLYGKQLCYGCAAAWFGDDDDDATED